MQLIESQAYDTNPQEEDREGRVERRRKGWREGEGAKGKMR